MPKNIYLPEIPKYSTVSYYYPKSEYNLTPQEQRINELAKASYQVEYEAETSQGSQYGPGRRNFGDFCGRIKSSLGSYITARISCDSDNYVSGNDYAGAVIYAINGNFTWTNSCGDAAGRNGRSFYIIIKCTNYWPSEAFNIPGQGIVHDYLIKNALGYDLSSSSDRYTVCGGGFACRASGELRFNSVPLNSYDSCGCESDGESALSYEERRIIEYCWDKYKSCGPDSTFEIPSYLL